MPFRSTLAWITDKEFTGSPQSFSLFLFPLYCLTYTVSVYPCSPISQPLDLLHSLPCHTRRQAARIYADHKPRSYKRSTYAHSHILYTGTVCPCCNVLDPCHGFTFSFTLPMSITTQLFFRCYAALRQAQGKHRNRQFGAHARGSMARPLPSQSFTSLPLLLEPLPYRACPYCGLYLSSNYKTNTEACYLLFQALFSCQSA